MRKLFADVCLDVTKTAIKIPQSDYLDCGNVPIFDQGADYIGGFSNLKEGIANDCPYIIFGDHTRILKYVDCPCFIGADGVKLLKVFNDKYLTKYVYYNLLADPVDSFGYSRHFKYLKEKTIVTIPIENQKSIITELDRIMECIDDCEKQLIHFDELIKSRFIEMFGDPSENPNGYPTKELGEIAFITKLAGFEYTQYIHYKDEGPITMVRGLNCKKGKLVLNDVYYEKQETSDLLPRSKLYKGDIVLTYVGTIAECALIDVDNKYHLAPNVAKISLLNKRENIPEFFTALFVCFRDYIVSFATATSQPKISMGEIRKIPFIVPPTEKQIEFKNFIEQIDKSKFILQNQRQLLGELFELKMHQYFDD